ncbi:MAG: tyrosine-type recombinase/integrase [Pseudodesulfovibrio sp.]|uniref:tyrosine-type recombinase/integrase n=1 Tax=Pseudodesulfovibrio sp. TaxID=2035812 RepID=UPI003D0B64B1
MPYKIKGRKISPWRARVRRQGEEFVAHFPTKAEALKWEGKVRAGVIDPRPEPEAPDMTHLVSLIDWSTEYLLYAIKYSAKTVSEKRTVLKRVLKYLDPDMPAEDMTKGDALGYLKLQFEERSGYAANKDRKNLVAAWNWAKDFIDGFPIGPNPWRAVPKFPEQRKGRYVPPEAHFWKVIDCAHGQDRVMLLTMLYTAARKGEIFRLQWSDIDFAQKRILFGTKKRLDSSMEYDWIPMIEDLFNVLLEHRQQSVNEWVFVQPKGRFKHKPYTENRGFPQALCDDAEVKQFGCHAIRHLTASILWSKDVPLHIIQAILRHKSPRTTERYLKKLLGDTQIRPHLEVLTGGKNPAGGSRGGTTNDTKKKDLKLIA